MAAAASSREGRRLSEALIAPVADETQKLTRHIAGSCIRRGTSISTA